MTATISSASTVDEAVEILERDGVVLLPDFLTPEQLELAQHDLIALMETIPTGKDEYFTGTKTRRASKLLGRTRALDPVVTHPLFEETAKRFLCSATGMWFGQDRVDETATVQIGTTQCIQIRPGQGLQPLHRDDSLYHTTHPGPQDQVGIMLAVSDFTEENGATRVIPGSHLWDDERMPTVEETIPGEMKAGSALMWLGGTYHGGGQNNSDSNRTGTVISLSRGYLRQEENHYLSIPPEQAVKLPERIQELLGYAPSAPFMGWVEYDGEMADPRVVLGKVDDAGLRAAVTH
ncbi:phytanoyl-CoA dioxygenase family protein [Rhodococcus wratislaviensis]|uniref:phytanoyl-CoA dioxygenase family protein n=1 Tax=Rhodococcus wratislaviensis TaxID=44752 RepID=UPI003669ED0C